MTLSVRPGGSAPADGTVSRVMRRPHLRPVPTATTDVEQPLGFEDAERLTHRGSRGLEKLAQIGLDGEVVAVGQLASDDLAAELLCDVLGELLGPPRRRPHRSSHRAILPLPDPT